MTVIKLAKPTFRAPGALRLAGADGEKIEFVGEFARIDAQEREKQNARLRKTYLLARYGSDLPAALPAPEAAEYARKDLHTVEPITDSQLLADLLKGWEIRDIDGNPVPFTPENRAAVFREYDGLEGAFVTAYFDALALQQPEKNSGKPSGTISG